MQNIVTTPIDQIKILYCFLIDNGHFFKLKHNFNKRIDQYTHNNISYSVKFLFNHYFSPIFNMFYSSKFEPTARGIK